jgi:hypothetical protein
MLDVRSLCITLLIVENPLCCVFIPFINLNVEIILGRGG